MYSEQLVTNSYYTLISAQLDNDTVYYKILVHVPVEGVIGGSVCTHLGEKARPSPQTDTDICLFIVIYYPLGANMRHLATSTHPANGGRYNLKY